MHKQHGYLTLCTDNFTVFDVTRLISVLVYKYNINAFIQYSAGKPRIIISRIEMHKVRRIVLYEMNPDFLYKIG
jgi:hypothetical protein